MKRQTEWTNNVVASLNRWRHCAGRLFRTGFSPCWLVALVAIAVADDAGGAGSLTGRITRVTVGNFHTLFVMDDGTLWGMGDNEAGQLGQGLALILTNRPLPIAAGVATAAAGNFHSLFVTTNGNLWATGANNHGQLGDGTTTDQYAPELVYSARAVTSVAAGGNFSLFTTVSGSPSGMGLLGMGANDAGQLGYYPPTDLHSPAQMEFDVTNPVTVIAAGADFTLLLKADGEVWGMGNNSSGQLAGAPSSVDPAVQIVAGGATAVAAGGAHTLVVKTNDTLWVTGNNDYGQLGDNSTGGRNSFEQVATNVSAVAAGAGHSLFIQTNGSLWGMGHNDYGQLGDGTETDRHVPVQIIGSNVVAAAAGNNQSFFIKTDGSLWAMGENDHGQLGDGTTTSRALPVRIVPPAPGLPLLMGIVLSPSNIVLQGANGESGGTYYTLASTALALPPAQWTRVATNVLSQDGNFTITLPAAAPREGEVFYRLEMLN